MAQQQHRQPPARRNKRQIRRQRQLTVIGIGVGIVLFIFLIGFFAGRSGGGAKAEDIAKAVQSLGQNIQVTYDYTTTITETDRDSDYYGWTAAKEIKDFTIYYQGTMVLGSDVSNITKDKIKINGKKVTITVPAAKVISNEINQNTISYFDDNSNKLKEITLTQFDEFCNVRKPIDEQQAFDLGKVSGAQNTLTNVLQSAIKNLCKYETVEVVFSNN